MAGLGHVLAVLLLAQAGSFDVLAATRQVEALEDLRRNAGLAVVSLDKPLRFPILGCGVSARPVAGAEVIRALPVLAAELRLYPPELFRAAGLRRIVLVTHLALDTAAGSERVGGLASAALGTIFLTLEDVGHERWKFQFRHRLHHEIFHLLDAHLATDADREWTDLNDGFLYTEKPLENQLHTAAASVRVGFVSQYATANAREDKAETYAHLIAYPWTVREKYATDTVLHRKVALLKARLAQAPFRLGARFWLAATIRPQPRQPAVEEPQDFRELADLFYAYAGATAQDRAPLLKQLETLAGVQATFSLARLAELLQPVPADLRNMLTRRLATASADELATHLRDRDTPRELRLAAARAAAAVKPTAPGAHGLARRLIALLDDRDEPLATTAAASLQALTGKNFGPNKSRWISFVELEWGN
jgi:hypothetical protein